MFNQTLELEQRLKNKIKWENVTLIRKMRFFEDVSAGRTKTVCGPHAAQKWLLVTTDQEHQDIQF